MHGGTEEMGRNRTLYDIKSPDPWESRLYGYLYHCLFDHNLRYSSIAIAKYVYT